MVKAIGNFFWQVKDLAQQSNTASIEIIL